MRSCINCSRLYYVATLEDTQESLPTRFYSSPVSSHDGSFVLYLYLHSLVVLRDLKYQPHNAVGGFFTAPKPSPIRGPHHPSPARWQALFEGHPSLGMLATPLLLFHPSELMLGSALAPLLRSRAEAREAGAAATKDAGRAE